MIGHDALLDQLAAQWSADGRSVGGGVALNQLREFEALHSVQLPEDFRRYLLFVNGMGPGRPHATDLRGFFFWPMTQMRSAYDELSAICAPGREEPAEALKDYLAFADHLHWSWAYALNVSNRGPSNGAVLKIDGPLRFEKVTDNFSEFL